jgi:hypothetical protein
MIKREKKQEHFFVCVCEYVGEAQKVFHDIFLKSSIEEQEDWKMD